MMPLDVPFRSQEQRYSCWPACLRMVLAFYGKEVEEPDLCSACGTTEEGTTFLGCVDGATRYGYRVDLWSMPGLRDYLRRDLPSNLKTSLHLLLARAKPLQDADSAWNALRQCEYHSLHKFRIDRSNVLLKILLHRLNRPILRV